MTVHRTHDDVRFAFGVPESETVATISADRAALALGCSRRTAYRLAHRYSVKLRPQGRRPGTAKKKHEIMDLSEVEFRELLWSRTLKPAEILRRLGVTRQRVSQLRKAYP